MSFVNDVMAEEAGRKSLILFEDYSILRDVDSTPIHKSSDFKKKYWLNFVLVIASLIFAIGFVNQLPASQGQLDDKFLSSEKLDLPVLQPVGNPVENHENATEKSSAPTLIASKGTDISEMIPVPENKIVHQTSADVSLERSQNKFSKPSQKSTQRIVSDQSVVKKSGRTEQVLDLSEGKIVFNKKILIEPVQDQTDPLFDQAQKLLEQGDAVAAIQTLREILSLDEKQIEARLLLSSSLVQQGQVQEAINVYQKGLLITPQNARLAEPLAHLLVRKGKIDQSLKVLQQAAPSVNSDPDYHSFIAALQQQSGLHEEAIRTYQQILKQQPTNGKWWLGLGISLMAESRNAEALVAFKSSLHDQRVPSALKQFASQRILDLNGSKLKNRGRS